MAVCAWKTDRMINIPISSNVRMEPDAHSMCQEETTLETRSGGLFERHLVELAGMPFFWMASERKESR